MKYYLGLTLSLVGCSGGGTAKQALRESEREASPELAHAVDAALTATASPESRRETQLPDPLASLYREEPDRLLWFTNTTPRPSLDALIAALTDAADHGLRAADYDVDLLIRERKAIDTASTPALLASLDVRASRSAWRFFRALHQGRVSPRSQGFRFDLPTPSPDYGALVDSARQQGALPELIARTEPNDPEYRQLQRALTRYRELLANGEPSLVPSLASGTRVEPGDSGWVGLGALRERLVAFGDLAPSHPSVDQYDSVTVTAVRRFQERHGLDTDGTIGRATVAALNVTLEARIEQLGLAMERRRWFPGWTGARAVVVNLPFYELDAFSDADSVPRFSMRVVIGMEGEHATPIFADTISSLVFQPYWHIPTSLAARELIDSALADTSFLAAHAYEIVPSHADSALARTPSAARLDSVRRGQLFLRQRPGPLNSLGRVKFLFPNSDDIYLHDSPARTLFRRDLRALSHGCVRVDEPAQLAGWLLDDQSAWDATAIAEAMRGGSPVTVRLTTKVPVILWYATAMVDADGTVRFAADPYGLDRRLRSALQAAN